MNQCNEYYILEISTRALWGDEREGRVSVIV